MRLTDTPSSADQTGKSDSGRRRQRRYRCRENHIIRLAIRPNFVNFLALVHNVSATGMGFLIDRKIEPGTVLALQLRDGLPGTSVVRVARVVHVRGHVPVQNAPWVKKRSLLRSLFGFLSSGETKKREEEHIWFIGCRLSPPLSEEELKSLC